MLTSAAAVRYRTTQGASWATLLERFYARSGLSVPQVHVVPGETVPQPYKRLLVHSRDMTPTLEAHYGRPMELTVLSREREQEIYLREVLLRPGSEAQIEPGRQLRPAEYGMIRIFLKHLPEVGRRRVLEEGRPLGHILQAEAIPHLSWPQAFFHVAADRHISGVLQLDKACTLWGRRNVLLDGNRRLLAEVIEILAPAENPSRDDACKNAKNGTA